MKSLTRWFLFAGVLLLILGAKFWLIDRVGSDLPTWDQWDGESALVFRPYLRHELTPAHFFVAHNEHRLVLTKAAVLGLFVANGQWDAHVETVANAFVHTVAALVLLLLARRLLRGVWLGLAGTLLLLYFALPFAPDNTLVGFQVQFYLLLLFSIGHLWLTLETDRFDWRWAVGQLCAVLTLGSMASGFLSSASVLAVLGLRLLRERRWTRQQLVTALIAVAAIATGLLTYNRVDGHAVLKSHDFGQFAKGFLNLLAWPSNRDYYPWTILLIVPTLVFSYRWLRGRKPGPLSAVLFGLVVWNVLQCAALAYGRGGFGVGALLTNRYLDLLVVNVLLGFIFLVTEFSGWTRRLLSPLWLAAVVIGLVQFTNYLWDLAVAPNALRDVRRENHVRAYLLSGDHRHILQAPAGDIPYPDPNALLERLSPEIRAVMPASVRCPMPLAGDAPVVVPPVLSPPPEPVAASTFSAPPGRFVWRSATQPDSTLPYLRFRIAGDLGRPGARLGLVIRSAAGAVPVEPDVVPGERWKTVTLARPPGEWWLEVTDDDPAAWFAVTEPVELGRLSRIAKKILKHHLVFLLAGLGLVLAGAAPVVSPYVRRFALQFRNVAARSQRAAAFAAGVFAVALALVWLQRMDLAGNLRDRWATRPAVQAPTLAASGIGAEFRGAVAGPFAAQPAWAGTYVAGDAYTGRAATDLFVLRAAPLDVPIIGYPTRDGNALALEILDVTGAVAATLRYDGPDPTEQAANWSIDTSAWIGHRARLVLDDRSAGIGGWLGIGAPSQGEARGPIRLYAVPRTYVWFAVAIFAVAGLLFLPGLALRTWFPAVWPAGAAWLGVPGLLLLAGFGLYVWIARTHAIELPALAYLVVHALVAGALARRWWRAGGPLSGDEVAALTVYGCVAAGALAFAVLPLPVAEESYAGYSSQGRMIASPPDQIIPHATAAYFIHHNDGRERRTAYFGRDWSVASRGPLAPLAIAATFACFKEKPANPPGPSMDAWPASADAFYLARIVGILTNALVVLGAAALAAQLANTTSPGRAGPPGPPPAPPADLPLPARPAVAPYLAGSPAPSAHRLALFWLAVAPVVLINTDFLWPKLLSAFFICLATATAFARQPSWRTAVLAALAYFSHPIGGIYALLLLPVIAFDRLRAPDAAFARRLAAAVNAVNTYVVTFAACLAPWFAFKAWVGFPDQLLRYPLGDGHGPVLARSVGSWFFARWENIWLTFVPGAFQASDKMHLWIHGPLGPGLRWAIGYAKSFPGAMGYALFLVALFHLLRRPASAALAAFRVQLLVGGTLVTLLYWGFSSDGLGRNCLDPLSLLAIVYVAASAPDARALFRWLIAVVAVETLSVRVIGVVLDPGFTPRLLDPEAIVLASLAAAATLAPGLWFLLRPRTP